MSVENKIQGVAQNAMRIARSVLLVSLRCAAFAVAAWVCCWLSGEMWVWKVNELMEIDGPYYYSGFPIWFARTAAHGNVGGGIYIPVRVYLNMAVWFMFLLLVRGLLTGSVIGPVPAAFAPIRRRISFCLLMGMLFFGFVFLRVHFFFEQRWLYWCTQAAVPVIMVVALKWLRSGCVFAGQPDCAPIPRRRWLIFSSGVVFIILISICFNKTLPAESTASDLPPVVDLMRFFVFYLIFW